MHPTDAVAEIVYNLEPSLSAEEFIDVLERSTLAQRRPVGNREIIEAMLTGASVIVTARARSVKALHRLVGVSRAISDHAYCTYLSDLAVDQQYQRRGIGQELIRRTHLAAGPETTLILLAAPQAQSYYPHIGMQQHPSCWFQPGIPQSTAAPTRNRRP